MDQKDIEKIIKANSQIDFNKLKKQAIAAGISEEDFQNAYNNIRKKHKYIKKHIFKEKWYFFLDTCV